MLFLDSPVTQRILVSLAATSPGLVGHPGFFFTLGYGTSVTALACHSAYLSPSASLEGMIQTSLLGLFGIRIFAFILARKQSVSYQEKQKGSAMWSKMSSMPFLPRLSIWIPCSVLYVAMCAGAHFTSGMTLPQPVVPRQLFAVGAAISAAGLILETVADNQKQALKKKNPKTFCTTGLYRICRHPNYFGEVMFWVGQFIASLPALGKDWKKLVWTSFGTVMIIMVMKGAAKRVSKDQETRYGQLPEWKNYKKSVTGTLLPLVP